MNHRIRKDICIIVLNIFSALFSIMSYANDGMEAPRIKAMIKPVKATVGSLLEYRINIAGKGLSALNVVPSENREYYPEINNTNDAIKAGNNDEHESDPFRFVPLYMIHSIKKNDRSDGSITDIAITMQISYYRPGTWALPEIEIKGSDGIRIGYKVPSVEISAVNVEGQLQEIEPPLDLKGNYWRLVFLLLGVVAVAVAAFFAWRYISTHREGRGVTIPPIEIFLKEIEQFNGSRLIDEGRIEEFVFGISMIFRKYLSLQFHFDAVEMTTYEIERKIAKIFPKYARERYGGEIMENLNLWDLSKFAEFAPSREILHANLNRTVDLGKNISGDLNNGLPRV
ncbi:MAG: hypothetical protein A2176_10270 [Spirochaetes bacterium RBG_13_51_14]|nr:MAG: hypothetical protein A2176_10270 [Spirochaetes bacterium RBG_13_51_14]